MKVGVISDTHDRLPTFRQALAMFQRLNVGAILHAGDYVAPFAAKLLADPELVGDTPVFGVYGNNDGERAGLKKVLPQLVDGFVPPLNGLPRFVRRLVDHVDWTAEQPCFDGLTKELARLFRVDEIGARDTEGGSGGGAAGDEEAAETARGGLAEAKKVTTRVECHRVLGIVATRRSDLAAAEAHFNEGADEARGCGASSPCRGVSSTCDRIAGSETRLRVVRAPEPQRREGPQRAQDRVAARAWGSSPVEEMRWRSM